MENGRVYVCTCLRVPLSTFPYSASPVIIFGSAFGRVIVKARSRTRLMLYFVQLLKPGGVIVVKPRR